MAAASLFAGYQWQSAKMKARLATAVETVPADTEARETALTAIDEAISAKYEKRTAGALAALDRARRTDPSVPGIDLSLAEIALNEKQFIEMRVAAGAARKEGEYAADGAVLLGVDKWLNRGASDREMSSAADAASAYFAEATGFDFFNAPAWFFWGDVLRYVGREDEGRERALAALHRYNPWDSSDVIAAKIVFASAEAGDTVFGGFGVGEASPWIRAVGNCANARNSGEAANFSVLVPFAARQTRLSLAADPFVSGRKAIPGPLPELPRLP